MQWAYEYFKKLLAHWNEFRKKAIHDTSLKIPFPYCVCHPVKECHSDNQRNKNATAPKLKVSTVQR